MRVLITGSSGFIGSALMTELIQNKTQVKGIDIKEPRCEEHKSYWERADLMDKTSLSESVVPFAPTHIIHLAARTDLGLDDDISGFSANTDGVRNILETCQKLQSIRFAAFASTILVCKPGYEPTSDYDYHPTTPYGESKAIGEKLVRETADNLNFNWCIIRPTSIWGPGYGSHYLDFFRTIARGRYFHPGKANNQAVYGYIGNFVYQTAKLMVAPSERVHQKVFYLGDYWPTGLKEWADMIHHETGRRKVRVLPNSLVRLAVMCGDLFCLLGWKKVPLTSFRLKNMSTDRLYDTSAIQAIAGVLPYTLEDAVKETVAWLKANGEI